jgi:hypothetical protein
MKTMKAVLSSGTNLFVVALLCVGGFVMESSAQTAAVNSLQAAYSNKVVKLEVEHQSKRTLAVQEYGTDLNNVLKTVKKAGDFDGYVLIEKEVNRFKADKNVPASSDIPQIATSLVAYQKKLEKSTSEFSAKKIELCKQYLESLVSLRKELMMQGNMKEAGGVNDLVKQVEASIKAMESRQNAASECKSGSSNSETKLDSLFTDDTAVSKARSDAIEASLPPKVSNEVKKSKKGPPEALQFNGRFYQYVPDRIKWDTAKSKCLTRGGHLVTIESSEENDFISKMVAGKAGVWIGLYKASETWRWVTSEKFVYSQWGSGQPAITQKSPRIGVVTCAFIKGVESSYPSTRVKRRFVPGHTELSGLWEDAYSDATMDGYVCEWDE